MAVAFAGLYASLHLFPDNHANIPPLSFLQARCPSCQPTNSVKALKAIKTAKHRSKMPCRTETAMQDSAIYTRNHKLICEEPHGGMATHHGREQSHPLHVPAVLCPLQTSLIIQPLVCYIHVVWSTPQCYLLPIRHIALSDLPPLPGKKPFPLGDPHSHWKNHP